MSLKMYHMPKHCTVVYNTMSQDFTTVKSYHGSYHFILCLNITEVDRRIKVDLCSIEGVHGSRTDRCFHLLFSVRFHPLMAPLH